MKTSDERVAFPFDSEAPGGLRLRLKPSRSGTRHYPEGAQHFSKPPRSTVRMDHVPAQPEAAPPALPYPPSAASNFGFESQMLFLRKHLFGVLGVCAAASVVGASVGFSFAWSVLPLPPQVRSSDTEHERPGATGPSPSETIAIRIAEMRKIASEDLESPGEQAQAANPDNSHALTPAQTKAANGAREDASALRMRAVPAPDPSCSAASMALALCNKSTH